MSNDDLQKRVEELEDWKAKMSAAQTIPLENDQAIRGRFKLGNGGILVPTGTGAAGSTTVYNSFPVTVPANPTGTLNVVYNGVTYNLLYK